jgi:predicted AAA+ superfamily ATPase
MLARSAEGTLRGLASRWPIVCVTGPRQSGKTTLCRYVFPDRAYVSLEAPDVRASAQRDPRAFLAAVPQGAVLDEVQRVPDLLAFLQVDVDERRIPGRWILTGSANFALLEGLSQSLAGRAGLLTLLPLTSAEGAALDDPWAEVFRGGYPALRHSEVQVPDWLASYVATYVERDVRQILNIGDLGLFQTFLGLCAGRAGQLVNLAGLGADAGITHNTARAWLGVLEASYVVSRIQPWYGNVTSRLVRAPKLQFVDSGLHAWLLGVRDPAHLRQHPLRGAIFESWAVSEIAKSRLNAGLPPDLHFFRDHKGLEVDLLVGRGLDRIAVEIKSGATVASDWFGPLQRARQVLAAATPPVQVRPILVYAGEREETRHGIRVIPWNRLNTEDFTGI